MGNCFSVNLGLNELLTCCADRAAEEVMYIWDFKNNLEDLKSSRDNLNASMEDLNRRLQNQENPQMKRLSTVDLWLTRVKDELTQANTLSLEGEAEIAEKLCCCCYKNNISTYSLGTNIVDCKRRLDELLSQKFDSLVERVSHEPLYVLELSKDLKELERARNSLEASKNDLIRRVHKEEGGKKKQLDLVRLWISEAETLIGLVDQLLMRGPQEIGKLQVKDFTNGGFGNEVAERLQQVIKHTEKGNFPQVVDSVESEYDSKLEGNKEKLKRYGRELSECRDDLMTRVENEEVREGNIRLEEVERWQKDVANTIADADKLLSPPDHICSSSSIGESMCGILTEMDHLLKKRQEFTEVTTQAPPKQLVYQIEYDHAVGFQSKLDEVLKVLMKPDVKILGLYGLGGVGKTTLLTHINNRLVNTPSNFDFVIWIVVTKDYTISKVQNEIGDRIGIAAGDWKKKEIGERSECIHNLLLKKKFVLLLDDLWEEVHLEKVGIPIPRRQSGSKIVLTTQSEMVCILMEATNRIKVQKLPPEQAWQLFEDKVGEETLSADPNIRPIAEKVAEECDGLPLAIIVVASAMSFIRTAREWKYHLKALQQSASHLEGIKDEVFAQLKLSYDRLPNDIYKACFIYCALFPKDYKISKDDLVDYWISEKFEFDSGGGHINRVKAHSVVNHLVNVSLLEEEDRTYVKLHNMIRHMALWISCDLDKKAYNFLVQAGRQLKEAPNQEKWKGARRTSLMENSIRSIPEVSVCPGLTTLLLCRNPWLFEINGSIFQCARALTVLDLSNTKISALPMGVTELYSLQYLNLSRTWIQQLPPELRRLSRLIYLNLNHNDLMDMIPKGLIPSFLNLQVLKMIGCRFFYGGEDAIILSDSKVDLQEMQNLNVVSITDREFGSFVQWDAKGNASLMELESLTHMSTLEIHIPSLKLIPAGLRCFSRLENYKISIGGTWDGYGKHERSRTLKLKGETVVDLELSIKLLLRETEDLHLDGVMGMQSIFYEGFPKLKHIHFENDFEIQYLIKSTMGGSYNAFPVLESLYLNKLHSMEKICSGQLILESFRELQILKISNCDKLTSLFSFSPGKCLQQLRELEVELCESMVAVVGEGNEYVDHNNEKMEFTQLQSLKLKNLPQLLGLCKLGEVSFPKLTCLEVNGCKSLKHIFSASIVKCLVQLENLLIEDCELVEGIIDDELYGIDNAGSPNECLRLFPALQSLSVTRMENLTKWSSPSDGDKVVVFPLLQNLSIEHCPILTGFPMSDLSQLVRLEIKDCEELKVVTAEKKKFTSLSGLSITGCSKFTHLRNWLQSIDSFKELSVRKCEWLTFIPYNLQNVCYLTSLELYCCRRLRYFPEIILSKLTKLQNLSIGAFSEELDDFHYLNQIKDLPFLEELEIWGSDFFGREMCFLPNQLQHLGVLKSLKIMGFTSMEALPQWVADMQSLHSLSLDYCRNLGCQSTSTIIQRLPNLFHLSVSSCPILQGSESEWLQLSHSRQMKVELSHVSKVRVRLGY